MPAQVPAPAAPGAVNTIVVQTAQAAASQTAALLPPTLTPTLTPSPTRTPTQTPSPSPTFLFILSSPTKTPTLASSTNDLACKLTGQTPADQSTMAKKQSFFATWTVQNIGKATWDGTSVDFVYVTGDKLATVKAVDLPKTVLTDGSVTLKVPMMAPGSAGTYKTAWTLQQGKNNPFCRLTITIIVK